MYITPSSIGLTISQTELDSVLQRLIVTADDFSRFACTDGRMYGVRTAADTCAHELNSCVRSAFFRELIDVNRRLLDYLNYYPGQRWHEELVAFKPTLQLRWPFLEQLHVRELWQDEPSLTNVPINPFLYDPLDTVDYTTYSVAQTHAQYGAPSQLIFRHPTLYHVVLPRSEPNFPRRVGDFWETAFGVDYTQLSVHHVNMLCVDLDGYSVNDELYPFYLDSEQPIPFVYKTPYAGGVRYWFYFWHVTDHTFFNDGANYEQGEFYKLIPSIRFKRRVLETDVPVDFIYHDGCVETVVSERACVEVVSAQDSIVRFHLDKCKKREPKFVRLFYQTNSAAFAHFVENAALVRAVSYLTAANLPVSVCGCDIKDGFIKVAQKAYTDIRINPVTGDMVEKLTHGNLYGHLVYQEVISTMKRWTKVGRI